MISGACACGTSTNAQLDGGASTPTVPRTHRSCTTKNNHLPVWLVARFSSSPATDLARRFHQRVSRAPRPRSPPSPSHSPRRPWRTPSAKQRHHHRCCYYHRRQTWILRRPRSLNIRRRCCRRWRLKTTGLGSPAAARREPSPSRTRSATRRNRWATGAEVHWQKLDQHVALVGWECFVCGIKSQSEVGWLV